MPHQTSDMSMVQRGPKGFGQRIGSINDTRNMSENDFAISLPFLNGKMLYVDVARSRGRTTCVDHQYGGGVIFVERSGLDLSVAQFVEDGPEVFGNLGGMDGSKEFCFSRTCGDCWLDF